MHIPVALTTADEKYLQDLSAEYGISIKDILDNIVAGFIKRRKKVLKEI